MRKTTELPPGVLLAREALRCALAAIQPRPGDPEVRRSRAIDVLLAALALLDPCHAKIKRANSRKASGR